MMSKLPYRPLPGGRHVGLGNLEAVERVAGVRDALAEPEQRGGRAVTGGIALAHVVALERVEVLRWPADRADRPRPEDGKRP